MTLSQFLAEYHFKVGGFQNNNKIVIITHIIQNVTLEIIDSIQTELDISTAAVWISDSKSPFHIIELSWNKLIHQAIGYQLDYFARKLIPDFFPLSIDTDLSHVDWNLGPLEEFLQN